MFMTIEMLNNLTSAMELLNDSRNERDGNGELYMVATAIYDDTNHWLIADPEMSDGYIMVSGRDRHFGDHLQNDYRDADLVPDEHKVSTEVVEEFKQALIEDEQMKEMLELILERIFIVSEHEDREGKRQIVIYDSFEWADTKG